MQKNYFFKLLFSLFFLGCTQTILAQGPSISRECLGSEIDFCDDQGNTPYNFYWSDWEGGGLTSPFFSSGNGNELSFVEYDDGGASNGRSLFDA